MKTSKTQKISLTPTPDWIEECKIKGEEELRIKRNEIDSKRNAFFNVKKLLYESGAYLQIFPHPINRSSRDFFKYSPLPMDK